MRDRQGFALIAALWLMVALSVVALALGLRARDRRVSAGNVQEDAEAGAAAEAGVAHARALLERRLSGFSALAPGIDPWQDLSSVVAPDSQAVGDAWFRVRLRDAGAALNLNRCSEDELRRLLSALRIDAGNADRIAQAAMDWRDPDPLRRARGAERDDYVRAGAAELPSDAPFGSVEEFRRVRGVSEQVFRRASPYLTILGSGQVNLAAAPREVLLSLPGMTEESAAAVLRRQRRGMALASLADLGSLSNPLTPLTDAVGELGTVGEGVGAALGRLGALLK